jgi:hypothetical protein
MLSDLFKLDVISLERRIGILSISQIRSTKLLTTFLYSSIKPTSKACFSLLANLIELEVDLIIISFSLLFT